MQDQIHLREQIGQRLGFAAEDALILQDLAILDGYALLLQVLERLDEKPAGATAGSRITSPSRGFMTSTMERTTARGV